MDNPAVSFKTIEPLCGKPLLQGEATTFDADMVTCQACLEQMALEEMGAGSDKAGGERELEQPPNRDVGLEKNSSPSAVFSWKNVSAREMIDVLLDVEALEEKVNFHQAEAEAAKVLLDAARARQRILGRHRQEARTMNQGAVAAQA